MKTSDLRLPLAALVLAALTASACTESSSEAPPTSAPTLRSDLADSEAVTPQNLLASERYWPYRVALAEPLRVDGRDTPLPAGLAGVLIRVEASGLPRIDFGSHGRYELPVAATDLVARANAVRLGESQKEQPNFVHAIQTRMLDSGADVLQTLQPAESTGRSGFLCVFADPDAPEFEALARTLAPLRERAGVMTILFPQGERANAAVRERLRALEWPVAFLFDHLSESYTHTLLREDAPIPSVLFQTPEGRVLFEGQPGTDAAAFRAALDPVFDRLAAANALAESGR